MTNAEKIQQMPDEELLEWLDKTGCARMPYDRWRAWLAEEADCSDGPDCSDGADESKSKEE